VNILLNETEVRVLGSLIEKDSTTPDYYPLSLNALVNACNQKSSRDPVMTLDEDAVCQSLHSLADKRLAGPTSSADSRVSKYEHRMQEVFNFSRGEIAVLCVLLLRGPQTPGELRGRTERMFRFTELEEVQATLNKLMQREPPLAKMLRRQPGTKEARYMHLFSGDVETWEPPDESLASAPASSSEPERVARLEDEISALKKDMTDLKEQFASFRKQFE